MLAEAGQFTDALEMLLQHPEHQRHAPRHTEMPDPMENDLPTAWSEPQPGEVVMVSQSRSPLGVSYSPSGSALLLRAEVGLV